MIVVSCVLYDKEKVEREAIVVEEKRDFYKEVKEMFVEIDSPWEEKEERLVEVETEYYKEKIERLNSSETRKIIAPLGIKLRKGKTVKKLEELKNEVLSLFQESPDRVITVLEGII